MCQFYLVSSTILSSFGYSDGCKLFSKKDFVLPYLLNLDIMNMVFQHHFLN